jgi:V/A-type H+-transporting ATPase subunit B
MPVLTMPAGDVTHPVPDLTGYITEGQIVLSPDLHVRGVYPPFDALGSLSRLMHLGAGSGRTRDDHLALAAQLYAFVALARQIADLADVVGQAGLTARDRRFLEFADEFLDAFLAQEREEARGLDETLSRGWKVASVLPKRELAMIPEELVEEHYVEGHDEATAAAG